MTTHRGKSHNELGKKSIIIANVIQNNKQTQPFFLKKGTKQNQMHAQIERNFFDPRQPTKESLIELGLENRNPIIIAKVCLFT